MAMIRMSPDKMAEVRDMCASLAEAFDENMNKTMKIVQLMQETWEGPEMEDHTQALQASLSEIAKLKRTLIEVRKLLAQTEESMRQADQQITSQIRNGFGDLL